MFVGLTLTLTIQAFYSSGKSYSAQQLKTSQMKSLVQNSLVYYNYFRKFHLLSHNLLTRNYSRGLQDTHNNLPVEELRMKSIEQSRRCDNDASQLTTNKPRPDGSASKNRYTIAELFNSDHRVLALIFVLYWRRACCTHARAFEYPIMIR